MAAIGDDDADIGAGAIRATTKVTATATTNTNTNTTTTGGCEAPLEEFCTVELLRTFGRLLSKNASEGTYSATNISRILHIFETCLNHSIELYSRVLSAGLAKVLADTYFHIKEQALEGSLLTTCLSVLPELTSEFCAALSSQKFFCDRFRRAETSRGGGPRRYPREPLRSCALQGRHPLCDVAVPASEGGERVQVKIVTETEIDSSSSSAAESESPSSSASSSSSSREPLPRSYFIAATPDAAGTSSAKGSSSDTSSSKTMRTTTAPRRRSGATSHHFSNENVPAEGSPATVDAPLSCGTVASGGTKRKKVNPGGSALHPSRRDANSLSFVIPSSVARDSASHTRSRRASIEFTGSGGGADTMEVGVGSCNVSAKDDGGSKEAGSEEGDGERTQMMPLHALGATVSVVPSACDGKIVRKLAFSPSASGLRFSPLHSRSSSSRSALGASPLHQCFQGKPSPSQRGTFPVGGAAAADDGAMEFPSLPTSAGAPAMASATFADPSSYEGMDLDEETFPLSPPLRPKGGGGLIFIEESPELRMRKAPAVTRLQRDSDVVFK